MQSIPKSPPLAALPTLALTILTLGAAAGAVRAQSGRDVRVENFPDVQRVEGTVEVEEPIPHAEAVRIEDVVVATVARHELTDLADAGVVDTAGFTSMVLSVAGEVKGRPAADSVVGVLLVPDETPIVEALRRGEDLLLPLEVTADVAAGSSGFFAGQETVPIGFPRYRVFLYNTGRHSVGASVYVYLRH